MPERTCGMPKRSTGMLARATNSASGRTCPRFQLGHATRQLLLRRRRLSSRDCQDQADCRIVNRASHHAPPSCCLAICSFVKYEPIRVSIRTSSAGRLQRNDATGGQQSPPDPAPATTRCLAGGLFNLPDKDFLRLSSPSLLRGLDSLRDLSTTARPAFDVSRW